MKHMFIYSINIFVSMLSFCLFLFLVLTHPIEFSPWFGRHHHHHFLCLHSPFSSSSLFFFYFIRQFPLISLNFQYFSLSLSFFVSFPTVDQWQANRPNVLLPNTNCTLMHSTLHISHSIAGFFKLDLILNCTL